MQHILEKKTIKGFLPGQEFHGIPDEKRSFALWSTSRLKIQPRSFVLRNFFFKRGQSLIL